MYSDTGSENLAHDVTPRSPKRILPGPLEIQIPRTVFYVAEEMVEKKKVMGQGDMVQDREDVADYDVLLVSRLSVLLRDPSIFNFSQIFLLFTQSSWHPIKPSNFIYNCSSNSQ